MILFAGAIAAAAAAARRHRENHGQATASHKPLTRLLVGEVVAVLRTVGIRLRHPLRNAERDPSWRPYGRRVGMTLRPSRPPLSGTVSSVLSFDAGTR